MKLLGIEDAEVIENLKTRRGLAPVASLQAKNPNSQKWKTQVEKSVNWSKKPKIEKKFSKASNHVIVEFS